MDGDATWDSSKAVVAALQLISRCPAQSSTSGNTFLASVSKFPSLFSRFVLLHWPELFPSSLPQALFALKVPWDSELRSSSPPPDTGQARRACPLADWSSGSEMND